MNNPDVLKTKHHFEILDGLRGIAAVSVVTFHFMEVVFSDYSKNFIGHGFLAVDFFFCLSGFVIGYAYDDRVAKMGILEFFKSRLIRLHPLVVLGSVIGLVVFLFDPLGGNPYAVGVGKIILTFITSILLIPFPTMAERVYNLFSFNAPAWSLFGEYVANIFYAFILYKLSRRYLIIVVILAAIVLCGVSFHAGNLMGGWSGPTFWQGIARLTYSFCAGLLVYRLNWIIQNKLGFVGVAMLLLLAFLMPYFKWNWLAEAIVVMFYFPMMIALGAGAVLKPAFSKICRFSGNISYPLYMSHYAFIWVFANYLTKFKPDQGRLTLVIVAGVMLLVCFAYLVMVLYDIPVRKYLTARRKRSQLS